MPHGSTPATLPESADVAVIGAGFTGLSAARALARRGVNVVVLEAETIGWGASSRNGGMVLTGLKLDVPTLTRRYGRETVHKMYAATLESIQCVEQIVVDENIACDFARCGHLEVASKQAHFDAYQASAALLQREFGRTQRVVPKSELRSEIGSDIYFGGLVDEDSAGINPARFVAGLAEAARRAGACLQEHARVEKIGRQVANTSRRHRITTTRGAVEAREVLLASGAYTTGYSPQLRKKIIPIGSYIIVTAPLPDALARELSPRNRMMYNSLHFTHYYRLTPDRRMLFGGRAAFFPETQNTIRRSAEILRRDMVMVFPQLREVPVEYVWGGTLDFPLDLMPHTGSMDAMRYAVGYAGHGVAMATYLGAQLAAVLCGAVDDSPFSKIKFPSPPIGLRSGHTWALPLAGLYYRFLDLIS